MFQRTDIIKIDAHFLEMSIKGYCFIEETASKSGISETISMGLQNRDVPCKVHCLDLGRDFVPHGNTNSLYQKTGLDHESIAAYISEVLAHED